MAILDSLSRLGTALVASAVALFGILMAIVRWFIFALSIFPVILLLVALSVGGYFIAQNNAAILGNLSSIRCSVGALYSDSLAQLLNYTREFYNYLICWWNLFCWYPYGLVRSVIIPVTIDCNVYGAIRTGFQFLKVVFTDVTDFVMPPNHKWLTQSFDYTNTCAAWVAFWTSWQHVICCGCGDLCPFFTSMPFYFPPFFVNPLGLFGSNQIRDEQFWCAIGEFGNGWLSLFQDILLIIRQFVYTTYGEQRPTFKKTFDAWCNSVTCLMRSTEHAIQDFWDTYIPFRFNFDQILCFFDKLFCIQLKSINLLMKILLNFDLAIVQFYSNPYFKVEIKRDFIEIVNLFAAPSDFANVTIAPPFYYNISVPTAPLYLNNVTISSYYLDTRNQATLEGRPNPVYNMTRFTDCFGQMLQRIFCDPTFNGTTCAATWNGTVLEYFDFNCPNVKYWTMIADWMTLFFETLLHFGSANEFFIYLDKQPFSTLLKEDAVSFVECFSVMFYVVRDYGFALGTVIVEFFRFVICTAELYFRVFIGIVTLPYYERYMPGTYNFVSDPEQVALTMSLSFYDRLIIGTKRDNTATLVNSLCFLLNTAFHFPYAGCDAPCVPGGFEQPPVNFTHPPSSVRSHASRVHPFHGYAADHNVAFSPLLIYDRMQAPGATDALAFAYKGIDKKLEEFVSSFRDIPTCGKKFAEWQTNTCPSPQDYWNTHARKSLHSHGDRAILPLPEEVPPVGPALCAECFNLCCLPRSLIVLASHVLSFGARLASNFIISRGGFGSPYFSGTGCNYNTSSAGNCLAKDLSVITADLMAPLGCLCQFIKLLLPTSLFPFDPCCFFMLIGELMGVLAQIAINVANSIVSDYNGESSNIQQYAYLKAPMGTPGLLADFDIALELSRKTFQCACNFLTAIFGTVLYATGANPDLIASANPCCVYQKIFLAAVEAVRLLAQLIVAFTDLHGQGACYLYNRPQCQGGNYSHTLTTLPIYIQYERVISQLFTQREAIPPAGTCSVNVSPNGNMTALEGIPTCYCNLANAILAVSFKVAENVFALNTTFGDHSNAQGNFCFMDICSPIFASGLVIQEALKVAGQVAVGLIQDWEQRCVLVAPQQGGFRPRVQEVPPGTRPYFCSYLPVQLLNAFFCDEYGGVNVLQNFNPITNPQSLFPNEAPLPICIKIEPVLDALNFFFNSSLCIQGKNSGVGNGVVNILDRFLQWFTAWISLDVFSPILFPISVIWPNCLCSGGPSFMGIVRPFGSLVVTTIRQAFILIRNFGDPTFWAPAAGSFSVPSSLPLTGLNSNNVNTFRRSWVVRGLGPIADAFCDTVTNAACLLSMILGDTCEKPRYTVVSSIFRYLFEAVFRVIAIIEAFARLIAKQVSGGCITLEDPTGAVQTICKPNTGPAFQSFVFGGGVQLLTRPLGELAVAVGTFVVDAFIGIGRLGCTAMCDGGFQADNTIRFKPSKNPCDCYNQSPYIFSTRLVKCDAQVLCNGPVFAQPFSELFGDQSFDAFGFYYAGGLDSCRLTPVPDIKIFSTVFPGVGPADFWELWTTGMFTTYDGTSLFANISKPYIPQAEFSQWAGVWNATNPSIPAYVKFATFNFRSCNIFLPNLTDPTTGIRVPFIENDAVPVGWAPNSQGFFGSQNTQSVGSKCPLFPTDGYRSYEQLQAMEQARGREYNLNSPDFDMLRYCSLGGQSYYALPDPVNGIPNPAPYWPTMQNTAGCSTPVSVGASSQLADAWTLSPVVYCIKPNADYRTACETFTSPDGQAIPFNFTSTPTLAQLAAQKAFVQYSLAGDDISHMPGGDVTTSLTYTGTTSPLLVGSRWSPLTVNYHRIHGQVYYIDMDNPSAPGTTSGLLRANDTFFLGVNRFQYLRGYQVNTNTMTNGAPLGKFAFTPQTDGDNSFLRAKWNRNPYIMLPLCRRDEDAPPSPKYGWQYPPDVDPIRGAAVKLGGTTTNWTFANGQSQLVANYTYYGGIGMTQYQMFQASSIKCVDGQICKNDQNVPCSPSMPIVLDGALRASILYLKCLASKYIPELEGVLSLLLKILAWVWQVSAGIIKFLVSIVVLALDLIFIIAGFSGCDFCSLTEQIFTAIITVIRAFIDIFQQRVILTDAKRSDTVLDNAQNFQFASSAFTTAFQSAVDTAACIDDPLPCFCKLVNMPDSCYFNETTGSVSPQQLTTADVTMYLGDHFQGNSVCDLLIQNHTADNWLDISRGERYLYVDCVSKRVLGETINRHIPMVPADSLYTLDAVPRIVQALIDSAKITGTQYQQKQRDYEEFTWAQNAKRDHERRKQRKEEEKDPWVKMMREAPEKYEAFITAHRKTAERVFIKDKIVKPDNFLFHSVLDAAEVWAKYKTGYYHYLAQDVGQAFVQNGVYESIMGRGNVTQSIANVVESARQILNTLPSAKDWHDMQHLSFVSFDDIGKGLRNLMQLKPSSFAFTPGGPVFRENVTVFENFTISDVYSRARNHFAGVVSHWRFNLPSVSVLDIIPTPATFTARWTPRNTHAIESLRRMMYRVTNSLWPHHLTEQDHKRYIVDGNCSYYDGAVNLALMQIDYCLNKFNLSIPPGSANKRDLSDYLEKTSPIRTGGFFNTYDKSRYTWTGNQIRMTDTHTAPTQRAPLVSVKNYRRTVTNAPTDSTPPAFNWYTWLVQRLEDLFNVDIAQSSSQLTSDVSDWFTNDKVEESDYPNVGFKYWLKFMFTCEFPENLNCGRGVGLEEALRIVGTWFLIIILISLFVAPGLLGLFGGFFLFILFFVIVSIVAWHYSPWCLFLTPSFVPRPGISVPVLPIPMSFWALPECLMDQIIALIEKYISTCPAFFEDLSYAIIGSTCPTCPEKITWVSCVEVGIYDGFSNWMFFFYHFISPSAFKTIVGALQSSFFHVVPGASEYMENLLRTFQTTSPTEMQQQLFCFWITILSMLWPILFILVFVSLAAMLIVPILTFIGSIWGIIVATPIYDAITGKMTGYFEIPGQYAAATETAEETGPAAADAEKEESSESSDSVKPRIIVPYTPVSVQKISQSIRHYLGYGKEKKE